MKSNKYEQLRTITNNHEQIRIITNNYEQKRTKTDAERSRTFENVRPNKLRKNGIVYEINFKKIEKNCKRIQIQRVNK
jgi:hypothetical protein